MSKRTAGRSAAHPAVVLVVDDDPDARPLFGVLEQSPGHLVRCADHGIAAIGLERSTRFDLTPTELPAVTGYANLLAIRDSATPAPAVMVTEDREHPTYRVDGVDPTLIDPLAFLARLERWLEAEPDLG